MSLHQRWFSWLPPLCFKDFPFHFPISQFLTSYLLYFLLCLFMKIFSWLLAYWLSPALKHKLPNGRVLTFSVLYCQNLEQYLAHNRCTISICWMEGREGAEWTHRHIKVSEWASVTGLKGYFGEVTCPVLVLFHRTIWPMQRCKDCFLKCHFLPFTSACSFPHHSRWVYPTFQNYILNGPFG